ncbi:MAG: cache domain-containing protein, partial [Psychromonas sp.]
MRLKPKLALFILPVILLQIIILIIPSQLRYQDYVSDKMKGHISDSIEQVENTLHIRLQAMQADSLLFSRSSILNKYIRIEDEEIRFNLLHRVVLGEFSSFMDSHPEYIEISLLALDGYEEVSLHNQHIRNLSDQEQESSYFKNIVKSPSDYEISPLINPDNGQWTLVLARKIFQKNLIEQSLSTSREVKGYLIVKMNFDFLDSLFKHSSLFDNGFMMVHSANGDPIIIKGDSEAVSASSLLKNFTGMTGNNELQMTDWSVDNKSYIVGQKQLANGLICSIGWSDSGLDDLLKNIAYSSLTTILIVTILTGMVLFWLLNKLLIKPILELGRAANIMG